MEEAAAAASAQLVVVGLSHKAAPVQLLERFAVPAESSSAILAQLRSSSGAAEAALLSTCNRTECYARGAEPDAVRAGFAGIAGADALEFEPLLYAKRDRAAVAHAFGVACGLDSMIVGEPEILGQMKQAYSSARAAGHSGRILGWMFERAFRVAKQVRTSTAIGRMSLSIPALCETVAERIFVRLADCKVLCVGSGAVCSAAAAYFADRKTAITITSRSLRNAEKLAAEIPGACAEGLDAACADLARYDVIVCATAAVTPLLGKGMIESALRKRKRRPMAVFDLGVPRNVEPEAAAIEDLFLHTLDDLGKLAQANRGQRMAAADEAHAIIADEAAKFHSWLTARDAGDSIRVLRERIAQLRDAELARAKAAVERGADPAAQLELLANRIAGRLAHDPTRALASWHSQPELAAEIASWYEDLQADGQDNSVD